MADSDILYTTATSVYVTYSDITTIDETDGFIDCGTNEDLFLALAALRDDSDYMQWFTNDQMQMWKIHDRKEDNWNLDKEFWRKAAPSELIEHFKTK